MTDIKKSWFGAGGIATGGLVNLGPFPLSAPSGGAAAGDMDMVNERYTPGHTPALMFSGNAVVTRGLGLAVGSAIDINATAAQIAAIIAGGNQNYTVRIELSASPGGSNAGLFSINNSAVDGPIFWLSTGLARNFHTADSLDTVANTTVYGSIIKHTIATSCGASGRRISKNGTPVQSVATKNAALASIQWGRFNGGSYPASIYIRRITWWTTELNSQDLHFVAMPLLAPSSSFGGGGYLRGRQGHYADLGADVSGLVWEATQPWSCQFDHQMVGTPPAGGAAVIMGNVSSAAGPEYTGIDYAWFDENGKLCVRIINDIRSKFNGIKSVQRFDDGIKRRYAVDSPGDRNANNFALYADGQPVPFTLESNTLASNTCIASGAHTVVGNQYNHTNFPQLGFTKNLQLDSVSHNANYYATHTTGLDINANTEFATADFSGPDATTVTDLSGHGRHATCTSSLIKGS